MLMLSNVTEVEGLAIYIDTLLATYFPPIHYIDVYCVIKDKLAGRYRGGMFSLQHLSTAITGVILLLCSIA